MWFIWLGIILFLAVIEVMTSNLTTIWFVISGLLSLFLSFVIDNFFIQFALFVLLGIVLLFTTKKTLDAWIGPKNIKTNLDRIVGMEGIVTEEIRRNVPGEVKVDGKRWTAYADKVIKEDTIVKVLKINGVKIKVEKVEE